MIEPVLTLSGCDIRRDRYYVCTTGVLGKELSVDRHHGKWNSAYRSQYYTYGGDKNTCI